MADSAPMLSVDQVGQCDRVTGAVTYQAIVGDDDAAFALTFTRPRDGEVRRSGLRDVPLYAVTATAEWSPRRSPSRRLVRDPCETYACRRSSLRVMPAD